MKKINKTIHGSEHPYVKRDLVLEQMMKEEKWRTSKEFSKGRFLRDKARENYTRHFKRIHALEKKINGDAFNIEGFKERKINN